MSQRGVFVTFEGSEGCGKSTQIQLLSRAIQDAGEKVLVMREPGGTRLGEHIRHLLKHDESASEICPEAELLLFAASRAQLVREMIQPALQHGIHVLCDRFLDSTTVYQGIARGISSESVHAINQFAVNGCMPDLTFLLDLPAEEAYRRVLRRPKATDQRMDRIERAPVVFYEKLREGFLETAKINPSRFVTLDGALPKDTLASHIAEAFFDLTSAALPPKDTSIVD